jgi:predicted PilT family ATPase
MVLVQLSDVIELKAVKDTAKGKIDEMKISDNIKEYVDETESMMLIL